MDWLTVAGVKRGLGNFLTLGFSYWAFGDDRFSTWPSLASTSISLPPPLTCISACSLSWTASKQPWVRSHTGWGNGSPSILFMEITALLPYYNIPTHLPLLTRNAPPVTILYQDCIMRQAYTHHSGKTADSRELTISSKYHFCNVLDANFSNLKF